MTTAGIVGGIGPESTIEYYRLILAAYRERNRDGRYPQLIINSIDLTRMLELVAANRLEELTVYLLDEVQRLARAGADFGLLASNTPHIVFDALADRSPIPLISIVAVTSRMATTLGLKRVGLLGTRFTMQGRFYSEALGRAGIAVVVPTLEEQEYIHEKYMNELVNGIVVPETRVQLLAIVGRLRTEEGIDGVLLGGTELPMILRDVGDQNVHVLDTTRLHVEEVVARLLS